MAFWDLGDFGLDRSGTQGLTWAGQAPSLYLSSGLLQHTQARERRRQLPGCPPVLGPGHKDLLQTVDEALQWTVLRKGSYAWTRQLGQCSPDRQHETLSYLHHLWAAVNYPFKHTRLIS